MHTLIARARGVMLPTENLLARFVTLNILGNLATMVIGFLAAIALARWLGPANRGLLALMLSVSMIALYLAGVGVPWAVVYYSSRRDSAPGTLLGNSLAHAAVLAIVLIPTSWLLHQQLADAFGHGEGGTTWVLAAALVPIVFLEWTTVGQLQGMLLFGRFNVLGVVAKIAYLLAIVLLLGILDSG